MNSFSQTRPPQPCFQDAVSELRDVLDRLNELSAAVEITGNLLVQSLDSGHKLLTCGNGGSAADALHMAEELTGRYLRERRALPAICLNADVTALTCIGNDYGFERIFSRQIEALGQAGDVLVAFSTSGNSRNIILALETARTKGLITILVSGKDGGSAKPLSDHALVVPSATTARIQEVHTLVMHQWLEAIDLHFTPLP
jgi:D-sedoheptulose 7-phosphate isomerase